MARTDGALGTRILKYPYQIEFKEFFNISTFPEH